MARSTTLRKRPGRPAKTAEQRHAEVAELIAKRDAQVEQLRTEGGWRQFLSAVVPLRRLSWGNLLLVLAARPDATEVWGWKQWIERGRKVRSEEAKNWIGILAPWISRWTETDPDTGDEVERTRHTFFRVRVYDIAQTDPIEDARTVPAASSLDCDGDPAQVFALLSHQLAADGWSVSVEPTRDGSQGFATKAPHRRVVIAPQAELDQALTLIHEAGHIVGGHVDEDYAEYLAHRGRYEVEAESVAFVLGSMLGLGEHLSQIVYIASWAEAAEADVLTATVELVAASVHHLADSLLGPVT